MKKNKMMRVASLLLVAVLLTTCAISGTFAKYVTADSGTDAARVAKFGVVLDVNGHLFNDSYIKTENTEGAEGQDVTELSVKASATTNDPTSGDPISVGVNGLDKVVAPGTKNEEGMTFSIKGAPEVAVNVDIALTDPNDPDAAPKDIFLASGVYRDWTISGQDTDYPDPFGNTFTNDGDYYPVVFKVVETVGSGAYSSYGAAKDFKTVADGGDMSPRWTIAEDGDKVTVTGTLADMQKYFEAVENALDTYSQYPNYVFDNVFNMTWEWKFEQFDHEDTPTDPDSDLHKADAADTLLGNLAADLLDAEGKGGAFADGVKFAFQSVSAVDTPATTTNPVTTWKAMSADDFSLFTGFEFTISVTQID